MTSLLAFCRQNADWLLEFVESLSSCESPTDDKRAVDRCGRLLAERLTAIGGHVSPVSASTVGDHLVVNFGSGPRQILLLGHFDTVWPVGQLERMPLKRTDGRFFGP